MYNTNKLLIASLFIIASNVSIPAQTSESEWDMMLVREDKTIPSLVGNYEAGLMDLKEFLIEENIEDFQYFCHMQDDYSFTHVIPINSFEDLESLKLASWVARMENPKADLIYNDINTSIESSRYYLVKYLPALSYVPESENWIKSLPYRKWSFYYFYPGTADDVSALLAAWQGLYMKYDAPSGFRVFEGYLGTEQPLYIFTNWAEDPMDHHEKLNQTMEKLGEESVVLWLALMEYVKEVKTIEGWFLPQYSYTQDQTLAE
jgi:hypothetical protein